MADLSGYEIGWLVGILEGEGCFRYNGYTHIVQLRMTDEDVVYKVAALFERITGQVCNVIDYSPPNPKWKTSYKIAPCGESARTIMRLIVQHMSWRRRQQIWMALNKAKPSKTQGKAINLVQLGLIKETA